MFPGYSPIPILPPSPSNDTVTNEPVVWPLLLAVVVPTICLFVNLKGICSSTALFDLTGNADVLRPLFFTAGVIGCGAMAVSLLIKHLPPRQVGWLAGMLLACALVSICGLLLVLPNVLGTIMFPALFLHNGLGLAMFLFALIGGVPPYVAVVMWVVRAWHLKKRVSKEQDVKIIRQFVQGAVMALALIVAVQALTFTLVRQATQTLIAGDLMQAPLATNVLKSAFWCADSCSSSLQHAFRITQDPARQQALRAAYQSLKAEDIDAPQPPPSGCS